LVRLGGLDFFSFYFSVSKCSLIEDNYLHNENRFKLITEMTVLLEEGVDWMGRVEAKKWVRSLE
jgi:hypothetical protein